ncbi:hypothetical protein BLA29_005177 [Euroglyphus maynei]|uniref:Uncharacterized protein n=1 Tax=Euroglyphus maynei TaxID=6958 RepID=A0A1Y3BN27_EURMA|nr:hypothetical protein BLA29_005177 [Euroglyphus maynei]
MNTYQQENIQDNNRMISEKHVEDLKLKEDAIKSFKHRLSNIQNDCRQLQQQLNELRTTTVNNNEMFGKKLLTEQLSNILLMQLNEMKSETSHLKRMNEQLLQEKLHEKDRNIQLNCEFQSCLTHLRNENEQLKQTNIVLENKLQTFQNNLDELRQEYDDSLQQVNECNRTIKDLYDKITNYEIGKQQNELEFSTEILELKKLLTKMEENERILKSKHEQLSLQCEKYSNEINENKIEIERLTRQNITLNNENEEYRMKIDSLQQHSDDNKQTKIRLSHQDENNDYNINDDIKQVIMEKESIIREQEMKLVELGKQIECLYHERLELENRINQSLQTIQDKEMEIQRLNLAINDHDNKQQLIDQRISTLEMELAKEKERSKGLSLTLAKEKFQSSTTKLIENLEHQHSSSSSQHQQK